MSSITYGGVNYIQVRHAVYCKKCKDTVESKKRHDFKMCVCGSVGVDGGIESGNRVIGFLSDMEPRSMYCARVNNKLLWLPEGIAKN